MAQPEANNNLSGLAALSICESLLLALRDRKLLSDHEIDGLLQDAATAHRNAEGTAQDLEKHGSVATIIDRLRAGRHLRRHYSQKKRSSINPC